MAVVSFLSYAMEGYSGTQTLSICVFGGLLCVCVCVCFLLSISLYPSYLVYLTDAVELITIIIIIIIV